MISTFADYLRYNRGLTNNTIKAYCEDLRDFASYINDRHPSTTWRSVTKSMIDEYVREMAMEEAKPATIKRHISALRTFYKTLIAMGAQIENPARYVSTPRIREELPKVIEREAIRAALSSDKTDKQAKAVIAIIYETGMRLQEVLDLRAEDIDSRHQSISVHGKGMKQRTVYYGELTKTYGPCWRGEEHTQRGVRHMVYTALKPYSKAQQLSPHALRHTYATELLNNGMRMETIRVLLGHEHLETTEIYAKVSNRQSQQQYLQFQPTV